MIKKKAKRLPKNVNVCHYCCVRVATTKDHIVPKSKGGQNVLWNYVPACLDCNHKKKDDWPDPLHCLQCAISVALHESAGIVEVVV